MKDIKIWIGAVIFVLTAVVAQVKSNVSKEERLKNIETILIKQEERNTQLDSFLVQQMISNAQQKIYNDSILKYIDENK